MRACQGNINPNCVSTASTNELYGPAWRAPVAVGGPSEAAAAVAAALQALLPDVQLEQSASYDFGEYRAFSTEVGAGGRCCNSWLDALATLQCHSLRLY